MNEQQYRTAIEAALLSLTPSPGEAYPYPSAVLAATEILRAAMMPTEGHVIITDVKSLQDWHTETKGE